MNFVYFLKFNMNFSLHASIRHKLYVVFLAQHLFFHHVILCVTLILLICLIVIYVA